MTLPLRAAVIGGGLIAQAVHLPNLAAMPERFSIAAIADPSRRVREALAARYAPARPYADWRDLLEREHVDVVLVCSPNETHTRITLEAVTRGIDVFVEKPLCIAPEDGATICEAVASTGRVVQVGYMRRFTGAYGSWIAELPDHPADVRLIDTVTYDPWMAREPFVPMSDMVVADDVPAEVVRASRDNERAQVGAAVGADDPETVRAYNYTFLTCLVHDVNLVHGALDKLGVRSVDAIGGEVWADGDAGSLTVGLPGGVIWRSAWLLLRGLVSFDQRARAYLGHEIHELTFGHPYATDVPGHHRLLAVDGASAACRDRAFVDAAHRNELIHFHACVTTRRSPEAPAEMGRADVALLRDVYCLRTA